MPRLRRPQRWLSALRVSLVVGALYDLAFAAVMVLAPDLPARIFDLPLPGATFYLWLIAVLLTMLAAFYLLAAWDPRGYAGNVLVAIGGRSMGFVALLAAAVADPSLAGLYPLACADLAFAIVHAVCWWRLRR